MVRLTKIYTRTGDKGTTALGGGQRVDKDDLRVAAYGTVDELNAQIGLALALGLEKRLENILLRLQNELFHLGSDLCFIEEDKQTYQLPQVEERHVEYLEKSIDELNEVVGPLENFILPGGSPGAAALQAARTVCRRAERDVLSLGKKEPIGKFVLPYLNRLSDALFVMARFENHQKGIPETIWDSRV